MPSCVQHKMLVAAGAIAASAYLLKRLKEWIYPTIPRLAASWKPEIKDPIPDRVYLFVFDHGGIVPNPSPACFKLESFLRAEGIDYEIVPWSPHRSMPTGQMPWIELNGEVICDSNVIIKRLAEHFSLKLHENAVSMAALRLVESSTYWQMVYYRWYVEDGWSVVKELFFGSLPLPLQLVIGNQQRAYYAGLAWSQSIARHHPADIAVMAEEDIDCVAGLLGRDQWFGGAIRPSVTDHAVFGCLENLLQFPIDTPHRAVIQEHQNLLAFCDRMRREIWADWYAQYIPTLVA